MSILARRLPLLVGGAVSLVAGIAAGLGRLGLPGPEQAHILAVHGPLMVSGFFGTVIGMERAVALGRPWGFAAPVLAGLGGILLVLGQTQGGLGLMVAASLVFCAMALNVVQRQKEVFTILLAIGGLCWLGGTLSILAQGTVREAAPLLASFLVLTIAGERVELSRFLPPTKWRNPSLIPAIAVVLGGAVLAALEIDGAWPLFGIGLVLVTLWCLKNDVVRRTVRQTGVTRYVALCLLAGYGWALASGLVMLRPEVEWGGPITDAALHALFVGFVFSMVFGHAPVILPALLRIQVPFKPYFYGPALLLHGSVALRLAGDLADSHQVRQWGALGNAIAILVFIVTMVGTIIAAKRR
jgi:hypothetical protein